jgi:hypothetical protein
MNQKNLHSALKTNIIEKMSGNDVEWVLVSLQYSRDDVGYSLHASPRTFSTYGIQTTDFLSYLGFDRQDCAFVANQECYCIGVSEGFDVKGFDIVFSKAYRKMEDAERHLEKCGLRFDQPEGYGFFRGRSSKNRNFSSERYSNAGDGHTAAHSEVLKTFEDEVFFYAFSFISDPGSNRKGFAFHYKPKHHPLSSELKAVITHFNMELFQECPVFDFEPCYWWFMKLENNDDSFNGTNAGIAHSFFDAHKEHFSIGSKLLIEADTEVRPFGFKLLSITLLPNAVTQSGVSAIKATHNQDSQTKQVYEYDVAISFAGTERNYAEMLADIVRANNLRVFYDGFYPEQLWGKDMTVFFDDIYNRKSRYCVIFMSEEYNNRMWTIHERRSALARMLREKGKEYILPIKVDTSHIPGLQETISFLDLGQYGVDRIGEILVSKLKE